MGRRAKTGGIPNLKPDGDGIYYRELGWKQAKEPGKFRQHKFYLGSDRTDVYTLSVSFDPRRNAASFGSGTFGLATKGPHGNNWINAVDANKGTFGKRFVLGPWNPSYDLGTYGVDPATNTAWAVINYNADFAVNSF